MDPNTQDPNQPTGFPQPVATDPVAEPQIPSEPAIPQAEPIGSVEQPVAPIEPVAVPEPVQPSEAVTPVEPMPAEPVGDTAPSVVTGDTPVSNEPGV